MKEGGKYIKIKYITQPPAGVPSFVFFCNLPQWIKDPYKRFLSKIRELGFYRYADYYIHPEKVVNTRYKKPLPVTGGGFSYLE